MHIRNLFLFFFEKKIDCSWNLSSFDMFMTCLIHGLFIQSFLPFFPPLSRLQIVAHNVRKIQPLTLLSPNTRHAAFVCLEEAVSRHPIWMEQLLRYPDALLATALASLWALCKVLSIRNLTPNGQVFSQAGQVPLPQLLRAEQQILSALDWDIIEILRYRGVSFC